MATFANVKKICNLRDNDKAHTALNNKLLKLLGGNPFHIKPNSHLPTCLALKVGLLDPENLMSFSYHLGSAYFVHLGEPAETSNKSTCFRNLRGYAYREPSLSDILNALVTDAEYAHLPFPEFYDELYSGSGESAVKAHESWLACQKSQKILELICKTQETLEAVKLRLEDYY